MSVRIFFFDIVSFCIHVMELMSILYTHTLGMTDNRCIDIIILINK